VLIGAFPFHVALNVKVALNVERTVPRSRTRFKRGSKFVGASHSLQGVSEEYYPSRAEGALVRRAMLVGRERLDTPNQAGFVAGQGTLYIDPTHVREICRVPAAENASAILPIIAVSSLFLPFPHSEFDFRPPKW
jgi:hypothetical protein